MSKSAPTRGERRPAVDLIRGVALLIVVTGHLTLAVIDRPDGEVRGTNLLALFPHWSWVTVIAPMPLFFLAGGYANATSSFAESTKRLATLAWLATFVVTAWAIPVVVVQAITGDSGVLGDGARIATQPLWFFAAYAPLVALGSAVRKLSDRTVLVLAGSCIAVVAVCDVVRFGVSGPQWVGWLGFLPTFGSFWLVGIWWRRRSRAGDFREHRAGMCLTAISGTVAVILATRYHYSWALIDAVSGQRSNTTPPTIYTVSAGLTQIGVVWMSATVLDRFASRRERAIARIRDVSVGVYMWHLTAMMLMGSLIALGVPIGTRFHGVWWVSRIFWYGGIVALTLAFVSLTERVMSRRVAIAASGSLTPRDTMMRIAGVVLFAGAAAHLGLRGPRMAIAAIGLVLVLGTSRRLLSAARPT